MRLLTDVKGVIGYNVDSWRRERPDAYRADLAALVAMLAEGTLDPLIGARLPLAQAADAQRMLGGGDTQGKLVLVPNTD